MRGLTQEWVTEDWESLGALGCQDSLLGFGATGKGAGPTGFGGTSRGAVAAEAVTASLSPQEIPWHQRPAEGTHRPLHLPPRPHSWTLHPSGLQTSAAPSERRVSTDQTVGEWVCVGALCPVFASGE